MTKQLIQQQPIVCIGFPRWEGSNYLSSTVQLMSELSKYCPVLYVDYPFTYKDMWAAKKTQDKSIPLAELSGEAAALQLRSLKNGGSVHLLRLPPFVPSNFINSKHLYDLVLAWNARRAAKAIKGALKQLGWSQPTVINAFNPALGNALASKLNARQLIYYCYDEISAAPWIAKHGARHEQAFLQKADTTIVSSTALYESKKALSNNCRLIKNGVDLNLFKATGLRPKDLPDTKIIGYIGSVDDRLDYDLLTSIAIQYPQHSLVFLGRIMNEARIQSLAKLPNVHFLGSRPIHELGNYLQAFDVGLIPFVKNKLTAAIYPLKINEYLALGLAVVCTDFADLSDFQSVCHIAQEPSDFIKKIKLSLQQYSEEEVAKRHAFAQRNTWAKRAQDFLHIIQQTSATNYA